jgi:hypothetical protein
LDCRLTERSYNGWALRNAPTTEPHPMFRTLSLSALFFLALGLMFTAYAAVPLA